MTPPSQQQIVPDATPPSQTAGISPSSSLGSSIRRPDRRELLRPSQFGTTPLAGSAAGTPAGLSASLMPPSSTREPSPSSIASSMIASNSSARAAGAARAPDVEEEGDSFMEGSFFATSSQRELAPLVYVNHPLEHYQGMEGRNHLIFIFTQALGDFLGPFFVDKLLPPDIQSEDYDPNTQTFTITLSSPMSGTVAEVGENPIEDVKGAKLTIAKTVRGAWKIENFISTRERCRCTTASF